jgi:hypothetical protein
MKGITTTVLAALLAFLMLAGCSGAPPVDAGQRAPLSSSPSDGGMGGGSGGGGGGY